jgi:hypothetical protein
MTTPENLSAVTRYLEAHGEITTKQTAELLQLCIQASARTLLAMHKAKIARIVRWDGRTSSRPIWALGAGEHAPKQSRGASILAQIETEPRSIRWLAAKLQISKSSVKQRLDGLVAEGRAHASGTGKDPDRIYGPLERLYLAGAGDTALAPPQPEQPTRRASKPRATDAQHSISIAGMLGVPK